MIAWFKKNAPIRQKFSWLTRTLFAIILLPASLIAANLLQVMALPTWLAVADALLPALLAPALLLMAGKLICDPYVATVVRMEALAAGDLDSAIAHADHADCVGRMTRAMDVFRQQALDLQTANRDSLAILLDQLGAALDSLARGDLTRAIPGRFPAEYEPLRTATNKAIADLGVTIAEVAQTATEVSTGSAEIRAATDNLAARTEEQASVLNEAAQALSDIARGAREAASEAAEAKAITSAASESTSEGTRAVHAMIERMDMIASTANEMGQIVSAIDGIAFQTNLLALNAGVEAARAGDAGRGFAVVASEVRALALRAAESAGQIKGLIARSQSEVVQGTDLARQAGAVLSEIARGVADVNQRTQSMATSIAAQSASLGKVEGNVRLMDQGTQSNAAMVEQTSACARNLAVQAQSLAAAATRFTLVEQAPAPAARRLAA